MGFRRGSSSLFENTSPAETLLIVICLFALIFSKNVVITNSAIIILVLYFLYKAIPLVNSIISK
jgi:hypothetical protein